MKDGISFFLSDNRVILSSGIDGTIPPKCFLEVVKVSSGEVIFKGKALSAKVRERRAPIQACPSGTSFCSSFVLVLSSNMTY